MRILAIDYGSKGIGVAITDELQLTVRPLTTIRRTRKVTYAEIIEKVRLLVEENEIGKLVIGLPLNMDGTRGKAAARVDSFVVDLLKHLSIPIIKIDERLTSQEADQILLGEGMDGRMRRILSDEYAAVVILQDYLGGLKHE